MDVFAQVAEKIIKEQENIIGPIALEQAKKVPGLEVDSTQKVKFSGNQKDIIDKLVKQYEGLFGQTSVEVCKDAAKSLISKLPPDQVPTLLR